MHNLKHSSMGKIAVISTFGLIIMAVIAGVTVWMFSSEIVSALAYSETCGQERVIVHGFTLATGANGAAESLEIYAQNICERDITINTIIIKDLTGKKVCVIHGLATVLEASGTKTVSLKQITDTTGTCVAGKYYTVTLVSTRGCVFASLSTQAR